MAPTMARYLAKNHAPGHFKSHPPQLFSETQRVSSLAPNIRSISWSMLGTAVACSTGANIRVWNPERADVRSSTEMKDGKSAHGSAVEKVKFNPADNDLLASTGQDGMLKLWDVRLPSVVGIAAPTSVARGSHTSKSGEYKVSGQGILLTWHPHGKEILVGSSVDTITAIDIRRLDSTIDSAAPAMKYECIPSDRTPIDGQLKLAAMTFTNAGETLFVGTKAGKVLIYNWPSMQYCRTLHAAVGGAHSIQHSPAGNFVGIGGGDSFISLFSTKSWYCIHPIANYPSAVKDLSFSFDGTYMSPACGYDEAKDGDKGLWIYHADTGDLTHTIETTNVVTQVAWHPCRYVVAYAGDPGGLKIVGALHDR